MLDQIDKDVEREIGRQIRSIGVSALLKNSSITLQDFIKLTEHKKYGEHWKNISLQEIIDAYVERNDLVVNPNMEVVTPPPGGGKWSSPPPPKAPTPPKPKPAKKAPRKKAARKTTRVPETTGADSTISTITTTAPSTTPTPPPTPSTSTIDKKKGGGGGSAEEGCQVNFRDPEAKADYITQVESMVREANGGPVSSSELTGHCGGSSNQVREILFKMVEQNLVIYTGKARATRYFWREKADPKVIDKFLAQVAAQKSLDAA